MPEVQCTQHGVFEYKSTACPGCVIDEHNKLLAWANAQYNDACKRYDGDIAKRRAELSTYLFEFKEERIGLREDRPLAPRGLRRLWEQAPYERVVDHLKYEHTKLSAKIADIEKQAAEFEHSLRHAKREQEILNDLERSCPEAWQIVTSEKQRAAEQLAAQRQAAEALQEQLAGLEKRYGVEHRMGKPGEKFENYELLGAADICGRRYARFAKPRLVAASSVICVPWIDAFAELVGQTISVQWVKPDGVFRVTNADGTII